MKKIFFLAMLVVMTGCGLSGNVVKSINKNDTADNVKSNSSEDYAEKILYNMSTEEKVGQLFMVAPEAFDTSGTPTTQIDSSIEEKMKKYGVGGIILFGNNIETPSQTKKLINDMQDLSKHKLFIAVDEEGGRVARIGNNDAMGVDRIEPMGQVKDSKRAYEIGQTIGTYISELGFNVDFAPDSDVLIDSNNTEIGDRSFGSDAVKCGELVTQVVNGLQDKNVSASLKHFPGHGGSEANSHEGLSQSSRTLEEMRATEFVPFKAGIDAGCDFVMVAHLSVPNVIGDDTPSTLSKYVVTDLLKGELGFGGVVVSDSLSMGAINEYYGAEEATVTALNAGIDVLLMPENLDRAYYAVLNAVKNGEVSEERLNDACYRIISIKVKRGIL